MSPSTGSATSGTLEAVLRSRRDAGRKLFVPYLTGGRPGWTDVLRALADAGSDAIEVGLPFSDPVMDGTVIQESSRQALEHGATPGSVLDELRDHDAGVPLVVMTYYNIAFRMGHERFAHSLIDAGVSAAILADLPLEEVSPWAAAADAAGVETVLLAAPTADDDRLARVGERSRGFVYAVGLLGVTGERTQLADSALSIAARLKAVTDRPVLVGVGVSSPDQAARICEVADGVVVGSAVVRRILEGATPEEMAAMVTEFRRAID